MNRTRSAALSGSDGHVDVLDDDDMLLKRSIAAYLVLTEGKFAKGRMKLGNTTPQLRTGAYDCPILFHTTLSIVKSATKAMHLRRMDEDARNLSAAATTQTS